MKTLLLSTLFLLSSSILANSYHSFQQQPELNKGKIECDSILSLAQQYTNQNKFEQADSILQILKTKSEKINYVKAQAKYYFELGIIDAYQGKAVESIAHWEELLDKFENNLDTDFIAEVYQNIAQRSFYMASSDKAIKYVDKSLAILDQVTTDKLRGKIMGLAAHKEGVVGSYTKSIEYSFQQLKYFEAAGDSSLILHGFYNIAMYNNSAGFVDSSAVYFKKTVNIARKLKMVTEEIYALHGLADSYLRSNDTPLGMQCLKEGLEITKAKKLIVEEARFQLLLGGIYQKNGDLEAAQELLQAAFKTGKEKNDAYTVFGSREKLIKIHQTNKEFDKALKYSLQTIAEAGEDLDLITGHSNVGDCYRGMGKTEDALSHHRKALAIAKKGKKDFFINKVCLSLGTDFYDLEKPDSVLFYINSVQSALAINQDITISKEVEELLYKTYKQKGEYEIALQHHEAYLELNNKIYLEDAQGFVAQEQVKQNVEKIEAGRMQAVQESALLSARNKMFGAIAFGLLGILFLGGYLFNQLRKTKMQIELQNQQLQQLNDTKDKFFGIIAHDIRSPLMALSGVGNLIQHYLKVDEKEKLKRLANRVDNTSKQLSGLLDNLLNWALVQQGVIPYHPQSLSLRQTCDTILEVFENNADAKGVKLEAHINPSLEIFADESAFNTIIRNLISNAIKFTPKGGTVSLSTETMNNKIFININDTGTGISAERISNIFTLQKKSEKGTAGEKGTGIGLSLVKDLVALNKGVLNVKSKLNQGSQFTIGFPIMA